MLRSQSEWKESSAHLNPRGMELFPSVMTGSGQGYDEAIQ